MPLIAADASENSREAVALWSSLIESEAYGDLRAARNSTAKPARSSASITARSVRESASMPVTASNPPRGVPGAAYAAPTEAAKACAMYCACAARNVPSSKRCAQVAATSVHRLPAAAAAKKRTSRGFRVPMAACAVLADWYARPHGVAFMPASARPSNRGDAHAANETSRHSAGTLASARMRCRSPCMRRTGSVCIDL